MSKQRITADNFEQLIEIVKAVQRGKDPEEALLEKDLADDDSLSGIVEEPRTPEEKRVDEQRIDRLLDSDGSVDRPQDLPEKDRNSGTKISKERPEVSLKDRVLSVLSGFRKEKPARGGSTAPRESDSTESDKDGSGTRLSSQHEEPSAQQEKASDRRERASVPHEGASGRREKGSSTHEEPSAQQEKTSGRREGASDSREETSGRQEEASGPRGQASGQKEKASGLRGKTSGLREKVSGLRETLTQRGFQRREIVMIGLGAFLVIVIAAMITRSVTVSQKQKRKMEHVTADEGLIVMVEAEPDHWCRSYPVELTIRGRNETIDHAMINGTSYMLDEEGRVTVEVSDPILEVSAELQQGTAKAQAELSMVDSQAPAVYPRLEDGQITVEAADARSGVSEIRYAVVHKNQYCDIPLYQKYTAPFSFEKDCVYYFDARDAAGNRCAPVVTTMEAAEGLSLSQDKVTLFPGETVYLNIQAEPAGALLNNLSCVSADPDVAVIENSGRLTAVKQGSTVVTVSADGVTESTCTVTVSDTRTVTISALGDCTLGSDEKFSRETSFDAFDIVNGHSWFFRNVKEILEKDDVTFANLEGTLTTETQRESKEYAFRGDPAYTQILTDGSVEVVTLANNHSSDYGPQSLADTKQYLTEAGVDYCMDNEIAVKDVNGIRVAFIGIYVLDDGMDSEKDLREAIAAAKEEGARLIVTAFHWGSEKETAPDETQRELAHIAVDCGANLVVGHHPHTLQGIEKYNGVYIVYSLGNFCFGGNSTPSDMDSMIFRQSFAVSGEGVSDNDQIEIIPCRISSAENYNNYQPTPAQGAEADRILERINEYSEQFGTSFTVSDGLTAAGQ